MQEPRTLQTGSGSPEGLVTAVAGTCFLDATSGVLYHKAKGMSTTGWVAISFGGSSPGGSNTQVQFNDGGAFAGIPNFTWDKTNVLFAAQTDPPASFTVHGQGALQDNFYDIALLNKQYVALAVIKQDDGTHPGSAIQAYGIQEGVFSGAANGMTSISTREGSDNSPTGVLIAHEFLVQDRGSGTLLFAAGVYIDNGFLLGAVATSYGLYIEKQDGATNNYAIRIANQGTEAGRTAIKVDGGQNDLGPQQTKVGQLVVTAPSVPASASSAGVAGTIAWDSDFVYVCVATDTWKRTALSTW